MPEISRSLPIKLSVDDELYRPIVNSIRLYRHLCRDVFGIVALAEFAGAAVEYLDDEIRIKPNSEKSKKLLEVAFDKSGKALAYQLREWVLREQAPNWLSFVWDSLRRDVAVKWTAKDPEFTKVSRHWLMLQGARQTARFQRVGIGFPVATARPKLDGHKLILRWDSEIGTVEFRVGTLDPHAYSVWSALRDKEEGWKLGTIYLSERDGGLRATITHTILFDMKGPDEARVATLAMNGDPEAYFKLAGPGHQSDTISVVGIVAWSKELAAQTEKRKRELASFGSSRRPWGNRKGWLRARDLLGHITHRRSQWQLNHNHAFTRRIVNRLENWRCGTLKVEKWPEQSLLTEPWSWSQFQSMLKAKCEESGIKME